MNDEEKTEAAKTPEADPPSGGDKAVATGPATDGPAATPTDAQSRTWLGWMASARVRPSASSRSSASCGVGALTGVSSCRTFDPNLCNNSKKN